jgi:hypothetical protein
VPVKAPTLGSKLAAHFNPSRTRKLSTLRHDMTPTSGPSQLAATSLSPPPSSPRAASFDSGSSGNRSPTPQPGPKIMVSLSPDNVEEYKNLFTLPRNQPAQTAQKSSDSDTTPPGSSPTSATRMKSPIQTSIPRRGSAPSVIVDSTSSRHQSSRNPGGDLPTSRPKIPRKYSDSERGHRRQDSNPTPRSSDSRESPRLVPPEKPSTLSRRPSTASTMHAPDGLHLHGRSFVAGSSQAFDSLPQSKLRMRPPTSPSDRSRPPTMPLPLTPPPPSTPPPPPPIATSSSTQTITAPKTLVRPRAHTIGSSPITSSPLTSPPTSQLSPTETGDSVSATQPKPTDSTFDIHLASREELRQALIARNQQYDELASYLLKITETHVAEVTTLEKKISSMEREAGRRDKEIKGLTWLVVNNKGPPGGVLPINGAPRPPSLLEIDQARSQARVSVRKFSYADDSGAESHPTSGAESLRGSGTSGTESVSSIRDKKLRRPFTLGESSYSLYRSATAGKRASKSLAPDAALPDVPYRPSATNRSSMSSLSISPSSSTSSLLPPSPSVTVSSLSAIPEAPISGKTELSDQQEERLASRASNRISTSSMASSSTAASSAYGTNLKRSRPPSIAQVLEKTPNMEDVLEKLRPFAA